jgi:hypothetical protein
MRAYDLVVVEADTARTDRARLRLADVVQERGGTHSQLRAFAHHCDRVGEHVLVLMDRVLLELHGVELGRNSSDRPVRQRNHNPADGSGAPGLRARARMRSR